jgi:acyl-CoA oxidase
MLFTELGAAMFRAGRPGMFSTWMYDSSDLIQAAAMAYAERLASEQFRLVIDRASVELKPVLGLLHRLYVLDCIERTLGWFAATDSTGLPRDAVKAVPEKARELCRQLAPDALALTEAFGMTEAMLSAPIARDWVAYNEYDNQGEVTPVS